MSVPTDTSNSKQIKIDLLNCVFRINRNLPEFTNEITQGGELLGHVDTSHDESYARHLKCLPGLSFKVKFDNNSRL